MTKIELNIIYFDWMCQLVCSDQFSDRILSHRKLLKKLHEINFIYLMDMDGNRYEDGIDLRYRFCYEKGYDPAMIAAYIDISDCSVFEMMVALSLRCEEQIMDNPQKGNRLGVWFWNMLESLNLCSMDDINFDSAYIDRVISKFMYRDYDTNGKGGLFTINNCDVDMRSVDIWTQMCWYLDDYIREEEL